MHRRGLGKEFQRWGFWCGVRAIGDFGFCAAQLASGRREPVCRLRRRRWGADGGGGAWVLSPGMASRRATSQVSVSLLAVAALIVGLLASVTAATEAQAATPAQTVVDAMQPGWNLGNSFDAIGSDETAWGNPVVTQALLANVKAQGFNSIRIPVSWGQHEGAAPNYTIDATYLARVKQVVDW